MPGLHLLADGLPKPLLGPSFSLFRSKLRLQPLRDREPKVRGLKVDRRVGLVGKWVAVLSLAVALVAENQLGAAAIVILGAVAGLMMEGWRPETKDAQGPKPRPQQECKKNGWEGTTDENVLGSDRSGTVTPMSINQVEPAPQEKEEMIGTIGTSDQSFSTSTW